MLTTMLDIVGGVLLVAAAFVLAGLGTALAVAGVGCLVASWSLAGRPWPRKGRSA